MKKKIITNNSLVACLVTACHNDFAVETLTNSLRQSNDHILAGCLLRKAAHNSHHSVHPHFELHQLRWGGGENDDECLEQMTSVVSLTPHGTYSERQQQRDILVISHNYSEDPVFLQGEKKKTSVSIETMVS